MASKGCTSTEEENKSEAGRKTEQVSRVRKRERMREGKNKKGRVRKGERERAREGGRDKIPGIKSGGRAGELLQRSKIAAQETTLILVSPVVLLVK